MGGRGFLDAGLAGLRWGWVWSQPRAVLEHRSWFHGTNALPGAATCWPAPKALPCCWTHVRTCPGWPGCRSIYVSEVAVVARRDGVLKFMFRIADVRKTQVRPGVIRMLCPLCVRASCTCHVHMRCVRVCIVGQA